MGINRRIFDTSIDASNTKVLDEIIELNSEHTGTPSSDVGFVVNRGTSDNAFIGWDESADAVVAATTTATGDSTGNLSLTPTAFSAGATTATSITVSGGAVSYGNGQNATLSVAQTSGGTDGRDLTISAGSTPTGSANQNGGDLIFSAGAGDGTGTSEIIFKTKISGTDAVGERMRIDTEGNLGLPVDSAKMYFGASNEVFLQHSNGNGLKLEATQSGDADVTEKPILSLVQRGDFTTGPAIHFVQVPGNDEAGDNDIVGRLQFYTNNDGTSAGGGTDEQIKFAKLEALAKDITDATEDGGFRFSAMLAGTETNLFDINDTVEGGVNVKGDLTVAGGDINFPLAVSTITQADQTANANANGLTVQGSDCAPSGATNRTGGGITLTCGRGTGNASGGSILMKTSAAGSSGATLNASAATIVTVDANGLTIATGKGIGTPEITDGINGTSCMTTADNGVCTFPQTAVFTSGLSANEQSITNVNDIALDTISADGNTIEVKMDDNQAGAFEIKEGGNSYLKVDTNDNVETITVGSGVAIVGAYSAPTTSGAGWVTTDSDQLATNIKVSKRDSIITTTIVVDLEGTVAFGTVDYVIGESSNNLPAGSGIADASLARITVAKCGLVYKVEMICIEAPVWASADTTNQGKIHLIAKGSVLAAKADGSGETYLIDAGTNAWNSGSYKETMKQPGEMGFPLSDAYLHLVHDTAHSGVYTHGKFVIRLLGYDT